MCVLYALVFIANGVALDNESSMDSSTWNIFKVFPPLCILWLHAPLGHLSQPPVLIGANALKSPQIGRADIDFYQCVLGLYTND